jgi:hypothetical protein
VILLTGMVWVWLIFGEFPPPSLWHTGAVFAALAVAPLAAWRGWFWPLRVLLHIAWIVLLVWWMFG